MVTRIGTDGPTVTCGRTRRRGAGHQVRIDRGGDELSINGRPDYVRSAIDGSLDRLGVDHVDLWYLHRVDPDVPVEETWGAMAEQVEAGKVRFLGISEAAPVLHHGDDIVAIPGTTSVHHLADNVGALDVELTDELAAWTRSPRSMPPATATPTCPALAAEPPSTVPDTGAQSRGGARLVGRRVRLSGS